MRPCSLSQVFNGSLDQSTADALCYAIQSLVQESPKRPASKKNSRKVKQAAYYANLHNTPNPKKLAYHEFRKQEAQSRVRAAFNRLRLELKRLPLVTELKKEARCSWTTASAFLNTEVSKINCVTCKPVKRKRK